METAINRLEEFEDYIDIINDIKNNIEKELSNMKMIVNDINQLRVEAADLESGLLQTIDSNSWQQISEFTGLGTMGLATQNIPK